jgi:hypothetical protein
MPACRGDCGIGVTAACHNCDLFIMAGPCLSRPAGVWPPDLEVSYVAVKSVPRLSLVDPKPTSENHAGRLRFCYPAG